MPKRLARIFLIAGAAIAAPLSVPALGQRPADALLASLEPGRWTLRVRDGGGVEQICLPDARRLIQLRHPGENCDLTRVTDEPGQLVVQYTCRGNGYGRTQIRRESSSLIQIDTQGIAHGYPFAFSAEARRVGAC